jgi:hypothetical protein
MKLPRQAQIWFPGYLASQWRNFFTAASPPARVWLTIADHFEPLWRTDDFALAQQRVGQWRQKWPEIAERHCDSAGRRPRYCFFYPAEQYHRSFLDPLAEMTEAGIADVEVHIHHGGEGEKQFVESMGRFTETLLTQHGLLRRIQGKIGFAFIHGNFALDNSGEERWCGLNNEITILRDLGCYADFTMPSGGYLTQSRLLNTIYWAVDDPEQPKSYDTGIRLTPGNSAAGDLLMIPGPFGVRWRDRLVPRLEIGELSVHDAPTPNRARHWLDLAPRIGSDVFLKLFTHGAQEANMKGLLSTHLDMVFRMVQTECDRSGWDLYFASAWEMRQAVEAAWRGSDSAALIKSVKTTT